MPKFNKQFTIFIALLVTGFVLFISTNTVFASSINENKLIELTNQERRSRGLSELKVNSTLYLAAKNKAKDMFQSQYFDHYSPDGKSPWYFIKNAGYDYEKAGENLAMDFATSEGITNAWMASNTHRANILKPEYEEIAIATVEGKLNNQSTILVVQMFGKPLDNRDFSPTSLVYQIRNYLLKF